MLEERWLTNNEQANSSRYSFPIWHLIRMFDKYIDQFEQIVAREFDDTASQTINYASATAIIHSNSSSDYTEKQTNNSQPH